MEKVTENSSFMYTIWFSCTYMPGILYSVQQPRAGVGSSFIFIWLMGAVFWTDICSESIRN